MRKYQIFFPLCDFTENSVYFLLNLILFSYPSSSGKIKSYTVYFFGKSVAESEMEKSIGLDLVRIWPEFTKIKLSRRKKTTLYIV